MAISAKSILPELMGSPREVRWEGIGWWLLVICYWLLNAMRFANGRHRAGDMAILHNAWAGCTGRGVRKPAISEASDPPEWR